MLQEVAVGPAGGLVLGEQGQASFTLLNQGALEVQYTIASVGQQVIKACLLLHSQHAAWVCQVDRGPCKPVTGIGKRRPIFLTLACVLASALP